MANLKISHAEASASILAHVAENRIVQDEWHGRGSDGREIACLLGAIHPSVTSPSQCNGDLMPLWLAELTPTLFDGLPKNSVLQIAKRYGELVGQWHVLTPEAWARVLTKFLLKVIDDAIDAARPVAEGKPYWSAVLAASKRCQEAIASGDKEAARSAAYAARAAAYAARAASYVTYAARAADAAARAADAAAYAAAYQKLFTFLLDQISIEIEVK